MAGGGGDDEGSGNEDEGADRGHAARQRGAWSKSPRPISVNPGFCLVQK